MRQREYVRQLYAIKDIRKVQRVAAEWEALRAAGEAERRSRDRLAQLQRLEDAEAGWQQAVAAGLLSDHTVLAWSQAVRQELERLTDAEERHSLARTASSRARRDWEAASARHRLASECATLALRRLKARQEEARSAELTDVYLIRRGLP